MSGPVQKLEVSVRCAQQHSPLERHVQFWIHHDSMKRVNPGPAGSRCCKMGCCQGNFEQAWVRAFGLTGALYALLASPAFRNPQRVSSPFAMCGPPWTHYKDAHLDFGALGKCRSFRGLHLGTPTLSGLNPHASIIHLDRASKNNTPYVPTARLPPLPFNFKAQAESRPNR